MRYLLCKLAVALIGLAPRLLLAAGLPHEPVEIGHEPQFFVDDYLVDNYFAVKYKNNYVTRRFHQPQKHEANPLLTGETGFVNVVRDAEAGVFRMWYQTHVWDGEQKTRYAIAYAESPDGLHWKRPNLGLFDWPGGKDNNICLRGYNQARASGPQILLTLPEEQKHGYKYVMTYRVGGAGRENDGIRLIGSHDGVHWDASSDTLIKHLHSDTLNSIVYDPHRKTYLMTCRAKHIYRAFRGEMIDTGALRRVATMRSKSLWSPWTANPQNTLIPDALDIEQKFNFFYGMPMHYYGGVYWGFLWAFRMNDPIHTQLATSRDGEHWDRLPSRPQVIPLGQPGAWDDGMTFGGPHWVEVGDEWWFYYSGWDGGHQSKERAAGIGLATLRKEGLVSLHGPKAGGGVVVTRTLVWPGGELTLNVEVPEGEVKVRVSDELRKVTPGYDYDDCEPFTGDSVAHPVKFKGGSLDALKGRTIRLEIFLRNADLYTFRANKK